MVRGINWTEVFQRRPDLEPPGYRQTVLSAQKKRQTQLEGQAEPKIETTKTRKG